MLFLFLVKQTENKVYLILSYPHLSQTMDNQCDGIGATVKNLGKSWDKYAVNRPRNPGFLGTNSSEIFNQDNNFKFKYMCLKMLPFCLGLHVPRAWHIPLHDGLGLVKLAWRQVEFWQFYFKLCIIWCCLVGWGISIIKIRQSSDCLIV